MTAEPVYCLQNIRKTYGSRLVLEIDRLEVKAGEIFAVVGPSGAGKSTLLRLLNFLEFADQGDLVFHGSSVQPGLRMDIRRQVTTVFQRPFLLNTTVEANVAYGLRIRGTRRDEMVHTLLKRLGLFSLRRAQARTLSGGEMQRAALARALVINPQVLLLDEPTANLDPYHVSLIEDVIREVNRQNHITTILVTHNIFQARRLADRLALLLNGRIVETGSAAQFFEHPRDPRTRAFTRGEMVY